MKKYEFLELTRKFGKVFVALISVFVLAVVLIFAVPRITAKEDEQTTDSQQVEVDVLGIAGEVFEIFDD